MTTLVDHLRALLGGYALGSEVALLTAADSRAARLPRTYIVPHSDAAQAAIDDIAGPEPSPRDLTRAAYYLGL